jgi:putative DNA primase/helicase
VTLSLPEIARALGGQVRGNRVVAPGPGHSRRDRSLSIRLADATDGFVVTSFAGDDWAACRDYVAAQLGLPDDHWRRARELDPDEIERRAEARRRAEDHERREVQQRQRQAAEIWRGTQDARGSVVEVYLRSRGLDLPADAHEALRFAPACPWGSNDTVPAMVAALRDIATGELRGIHRTALDRDGRKIGRRMLGTAAGCAIMFDPAGAGQGFLICGEGIETVLTARQHLDLRPAWALGSAGGIASLPLVPNVHTLVVLGENDANGASQTAFERVGRRWDEAGRDAEIIWPPEGLKDLNDTVREGSAACL